MSLNPNSDFIYVVNDNTTNALTSLISDLNNKATSLNNKYIDTIKKIQDDIYTHQFDDMTLKKIYNDTKKNKTDKEYRQLLEKNKQQNDIINDLASSISKINTVQQEILDKQPYNNIRSFHGQNLVLTPVNDSYLININNNCLNVDKNNMYSLKPCDNKSSQQLFKINNIHDEVSYFSQYGSYPTTEDIKNFPYSVVKSNINNYCLIDNNGTGVSVGKCANMEDQKWRGMRQNNISCAK